MHHRKNTQTPEHEYLLATLVGCRAGKLHIRHVRVERRSTSNSLHLLGRGVLADDSISISHAPFDVTESYSLYHLQFPGVNRPNILEFAAMLNAITSLDPHYRLYTSDCYWFARMVFEGMAHSFHGQISEGDRPHQRGKFARIFPVLDRRGVPHFGMSPVIKRWLRYRTAVVHVAGPGADAQISMIHELIKDAYSRRRAELYALAVRADGPAVVDEGPGDAALRLESVLTIVLCCLSAFLLLYTWLQVLRTTA